MRKPELEVKVLIGVRSVVMDTIFGRMSVRETVEFHSFVVRRHTRNTLRLEPDARKAPPRLRKAVVYVNNRLLRGK